MGLSTTCDPDTVIVAVYMAPMVANLGNIREYTPLPSNVMSAVNKTRLFASAILTIACPRSVDGVSSRSLRFWA